WDFCDMTLTVTPAVLIPRDDTMAVTELAIKRAIGNITNKVQTINIADEITGNLVIRIINNDKVVTRPIVKF
ncbi:MAG: hypothetical protein II037_00690, partial [Bacteroidales bacterium]|nr:hypothetical protein [Bacteroidales bacterium]